MSKNKSTIYDLARMAEVSATTVSSVLSGSWRARRIAEKTALRVQRLAATHQYTASTARRADFEPGARASSA